MKKLNKLFKNYLKKIGYDYVSFILSNSSLSDMENQIIYFNPKGEGHDFNKTFKKIYENYNHDIKISMDTYAFFHELGHIASVRELENLEQELDTYTEQVEKLINSKLSQEKITIEYRKLKLEKLADKYAYQIYKQNEKNAIALDNNFKAIMKKVR